MLAVRKHALIAAPAQAAQKVPAQFGLADVADGLLQLRGRHRGAILVDFAREGVDGVGSDGAQRRRRLARVAAAGAPRGGTLYAWRGNAERGRRVRDSRLGRAAVLVARVTARGRTGASRRSGRGQRRGRCRLHGLRACRVARAIVSAPERRRRRSHVRLLRLGLGGTAVVAAVVVTTATATATATYAAAAAAVIAAPAEPRRRL